jgi:hypothetical protein
MSRNKRNIDADADIDESSPPSAGNASPSGTGTHAAHRAGADNAASDNKSKGREGRRAGQDGGSARSGR